MWVPSGLCPAGCSEWWRPRGLRVLGAPEGSDTPLAALGELGAAVGDPGLVADFLSQALRQSGGGHRRGGRALEPGAGGCRPPPPLRLAAAPPPFSVPLAGSHRGFRRGGRRCHSECLREDPWCEVDHTPPTNTNGLAYSRGGMWDSTFQGSPGSGVAEFVARDSPRSQGARWTRCCAPRRDR